MTRAPVVSLLLSAVLFAGPAWTEEPKTKAPMPQTRGMQGMDPAAHEKWAKEGEQDPYKDCKPNADKAAHAAKHPMQETKGMKGMDPKMHEMDCPEPDVAKQDPSKPPKHVHRGPGS